MDHALDAFKKSRSYRFSINFFQTVLLSYFAFNFLIHFEMIYVKCLKYTSSLILFVHRHQHFWYYSLRKIILFPLSCFASLKTSIEYNCTDLPDTLFCPTGVRFSSGQSLSHVWLFATPWTAECQASLAIANFQNLLKLLSIESVMPSNHLILCCPLFLLPSIILSIRVFSDESALVMKWPKYWSFGFSISPSNEYSGLIFFRMDWLDLLAVQGTLKSLLQHHSSKASIIWCSAFFIVQLSHPYMTTRKTIALTRWTFVDKVMSLLFNMLSRLVITFLLRSKRLLISRLQSPSAVILGPKKVKSDTVSTVSPSICHEVMGLDAMILVSECWALSQLFHSPLSLSSRGFWVPLHFLP